MADLSIPIPREYSQPVIHSKKEVFVSETTYWETYYNDPDIIYEWNNGKLEIKPVADYSNYLVYKWFLKLLDEYLEVNPIAKITGLEIGFRLVLPQKTVIRRPDLGIVLNDNPVSLEPEDRTYGGTFDICVESLSDSTDNEIERDTVDKKWEYAKGSVKEYLILDAREEYTVLYRLNARGMYVPVKPTQNGLIKFKALPGFQFRLEDLYEQPSHDKMSEEPIYQNFVSLSYQKEKKARQEEKKARQKAEAQALEEKKARQEAEAQARKAEVQALEEQKARQEAEDKIKLLEAKLARFQNQ